MSFTVGESHLGLATLGARDVQAAAPTIGPCTPFLTVDDLLDRPDCNGADASAAQLRVACSTASLVMWALTGRQFGGGCVRTIRPCCDCSPDDIPAWARREGGTLGLAGTGGYTALPALVGGNWYNLGGTLTTNGCGQQVPRIDLGVYPVTEAQVVIDGVELDGAAFRLDEWRYLVRTDGSQWPATNSLTLPDGPGVWSVTFIYGHPAPPHVVDATGDLAIELVKSCCGDPSCRLPLGQVSNMNRQGVNYTFANVFDAVKDGRTGIYSIDLCVTSVNPGRLAQRPRVVSPDRRPHPIVGSGSLPLVLVSPPDLSVGWFIELASDPESIITGNVHRDGNDVITSADVVWPDGVTGTFTTLAVSGDGLAVDSYQITHGGQTFLQPAVTRDAGGAVTYRPAIIVT